MSQIQIKTSSNLSSEFSTNGIFIPFSFTFYNTDLLSSHTLINIYHGIQIGSIDVSPLTPNATNDIYEKIRIEIPNTEIILTEDPYDALGNVMRFLSSKDDSIGRDGDVLFTTTDYKFYKRENGIYSFKFQMQGGSGVAVAAQWHFSDIINNNIGVDGDLLLKTNGQIYKKVNGLYEYQLTISGSPGLPGTNGTNGTKIYISSGTTYTSASSDGDLNIVDSTDLYIKTNSVWTYVGKIKGEKGIKGDIGATLPAQEIRFLSSFDNTIGVDGDIIISSLDYKIYKKILGAYVYQTSFSTPEGSKWHYNQTVDNNIGKNDDFLLIENGSVYKKSGGIFSLQVNIKGQDGTNGNSVLFNTSIDNNIGVNGDILFVGNNIYKKESGNYVLKQTFSSSSSKLKKTETINSATHTTTLISKTIAAMEIITLNINTQSVISIENAEIHGKKIVLYFINNIVGTQGSSVSMTNIVLSSTMQGNTITLSTNTGSKDSMCLEYDNTNSKWTLVSFVNNIF